MKDTNFRGLAVGAALAGAFLCAAATSAATIIWTEAGTATAWYTATNWTPNTASGAWTAADIAQFDNTGTATTATINITTSSLSIGAIEVTSLRTKALTISNNSGTPGTLTLNRETVNGVANTVLRNAGTSTLTLNNGTSTMGVVLPTAGNNKMVIDAVGAAIVINNVISGAGEIEMIRNAGTSQLQFGGNNIYAGDTVLTSGRFRVLATAGGNGVPNGPGKGNVVMSAGTQFGIVANETINGLSGDGTVDNDSSTGTAVLTIGDNDQTSTFVGAILDGGASSAMAITKTGVGILTLSGANVYTGATLVNAGTLLVNGTHVGTPSTGAYTVASAATLGGIGSTAGAVTVNAGGFLSPGASIESLGVGSATGAGTLLVEYDGEAGTDLIDLLNVAGNLNIGAMAVDFNLLNDPLDDAAVVFATYGSLTGSAFALETDTPVGYTIDYAYNDGNNSNNIALVPVPEPGAIVLAVFGILGLSHGIRRRS